jgi:hypothetical protein
MSRGGMCEVFVGSRRVKLLRRDDTTMTDKEGA